MIVPRGGKSLVARVQEEARVPVFAHLEGICHTYVDRSADLAMARRIVINAKLRRTGVCGATETLLVDKAAPEGHLAALVAALIEAGCEVRGDAAAQAAHPQVKPASEQDWSTEYLDAIISVKAVDGVDAAIAHIQKYGSQHTDASWPRMRPRPSGSSPGSTAPSSCTMPPPSSPTAASSAWAPRSASPPAACTRAAPSASSSSPPSSTWCAGAGRSGRERLKRLKEMLA